MLSKCNNKFLNIQEHVVNKLWTSCEKSLTIFEEEVLVIAYLLIVINVSDIFNTSSYYF